MDARRVPGPSLAPFTDTARFEVLRLIGEGGMGAVYEVREREGGARLALKTLRAATPDALLHLKAEFRALQEVRHVNLVRLHELLEDAGRWFFTMELVDGVDLLRWVRPGIEAWPLASVVSATAPLDGDASAEGDAGESPSRPLAASAPLDLARLRDALAQLARGLGALHAAGKAHGDVKPSNALVTREGRVVLVDFGLAADLASAAPRGRGAIGTRAFMAPELGAGGARSAASDWYAFGVVAYQALTGELPWRGASLERRRLHEPARAVRDRCAEAPEDLAALCDALLAIEPAARPPDDEVLRRLGVRERTRARPAEGRLVGRAAELAALRDAFDASRAAAVTSIVAGESGMGKSALARALFASLREAEPAVIILAGCCYEREIVPYNALDGVVDALTDVLRAEAPPAPMPDDAALLARVFPVLRRVPAIAAIPEPAPATPHELRTRACAALRALLDRVARRGPLVVHLDDAQWADADSAWLLDELLATDAPPLLLLVTLRSPSPALARVLARLPGARRIDLGPLDDADARRWAAELMGASSDVGRAAAVAREAAGHPLFLLELADHVRRAGAASLGHVRLESALWARVERLEPGARRLIEVLAIAGSPLLARAAATAADLDAGAYAASADALRVERLARTSDALGLARVEPYHDRVREAVLAHLSAPALRRGHLRLARALEHAGVDDAAQIGRHFAEGDDAASALDYVTRAAGEAERALAFEESAALYERALELRALVAGDAAGADALEIAAAEALSAAGHGPRAAQLFLRAAERASDLARLDRWRRAAEELFTHGRLDEGYAVLAAVLPELGLSLPRGAISVVARVVRGRLEAALTPRRLRPRASPASERELARVDVVGGITLSLWSMDPWMGAALQADHLRLAVRSADLLRVAFAFSMEAGASAVGGVPARARTQRWLDDAIAIAGAEEQVPQWRAGRAVVVGTIAVLECRWLDAMEALDAAARELSLAPLGHSAVRELMTNMRLTTLFWLGRAGDLLRQSPPLLRRAEERGNVDGWTWLQTFDAWALACAGRADESRARLALLRERLPARGFLLHRWYIDHVRVVSLLCEGRAVEAFRAIDETRRRLRFAPSGQSQRVWSRWLFANAALERARQEPGARRAMVAEARRVVRRLDAERTPWVDGAGACVRASLASLEGRDDDAARALAIAEPLLAAHHFEAPLACVRAARGATDDGWLAAQGFTRAAQRMTLPGAWNEVRGASRPSSRG